MTLPAGTTPAASVTLASFGKGTPGESAVRNVPRSSQKNPGSSREELSPGKERFASIRVIRDQVFGSRGRDPNWPRGRLDNLDPHPATGLVEHQDSSLLAAREWDVAVPGELLARRSERAGSHR